MPRRQTNLRGPKDNSSQKPKQKRQTGRSLDALAIAENEFPIKPKIRRNRLGDDDEFTKRKRGDDSNGPDSKRRRTDDLSDGGSDDEGHKWKLGEVDSDNDSELDSDEAIGSSDEEMFEGFAFRGSSSSKPKPKQKRSTGEGKPTLSENDDSEESDEGEEDEDDDLGEDAVDLTTAWDMNTAEEEAEKAPPKSKKPSAGDFEDEPSGSDGDSEEDGSDESNEEGSGLSLSDDEVDDTNERGLSNLQNFVKSMEPEKPSKSKQVAGTAQEQMKPTEYGLTSAQKLTVADLLPSVTDPRLKSSLKHIDSAAASRKPQSSGVPGKLDAPLPKRQQDRLDRAAAYEKSKETLDRWIETVKANRRAEHISFPLPDPDAQRHYRLGVTKPQTDLEGTIQSILVESGLAKPDGKSTEGKIQQSEELQTRKLPLEEIRARRAELRKHRDLLFREEVRAKRIKKIKSKSYRRVHRKEREKATQQERQALVEAGVDLDEEEREANERRRAEARMGSKHKESKWAKGLKQTGRTAWDEEARQSAADLAQREDDLRKRVEGKRVTRADDDGYLDSSSSESEEEDPWQEEGSDAEKQKLDKKLSALSADGEPAEDVKGPYSNLLSMKFMRNAEAARKEQNDAEIKGLNREINGDDSSEVDSESEVGRQRFGQSENQKSEKKPKPLPKNEFEEPPGSDDENVGANESSQDVNTKPDRPGSQRTARSDKKITPRASNETSNKKDSGIEEENPWLAQTSRNNRRKTANNAQEGVDITLEDTQPQPSHGPPTNVAERQETKQPVPKPPQVVENNSDSDDESKVPVLLKNHDLVKRAFAGDEVVQDFAQEKQDIIEDEGDKVVDNTLPGWGSWDGAGIGKKQQKRQKRFLTTVEGVKPEERKDAKLSRVIINEKRIQKVCSSTFFFILF